MSIIPIPTTDSVDQKVIDAVAQLENSLQIASEQYDQALNEIKTKAIADFAKQEEVIEADKMKQLEDEIASI